MKHVGVLTHIISFALSVDVTPVVNVIKICSFISWLFQPIFNYELLF